MRTYERKVLAILRAEGAITTAELSRNLGVSQRQFLSYESGAELIPEEILLDWSKQVSEPVRRQFRREYRKKAIGKLIEHACELLKHDVEELLYAIQVDERTFKAWLSGTRRPDKVNASILTELLGPLVILDPPLKAFSPKKLRELRISRKFTARSLAGLLRCHISSVSKWEYGKQVPSKRSIERLSIALKCPQDDLYTIYDPHLRFVTAFNNTGLSPVKCAKILGIGYKRHVRPWLDGSVWPPDWASKRLEEIPDPSKRKDPGRVLLPNVSNLVELYWIPGDWVKSLDGSVIDNTYGKPEKEVVKTLKKEGRLAAWSYKVDDTININEASRLSLKDFRKRLTRITVSRSELFDRWSIRHRSKVIEIKGSSQDIARTILKVLQWGSKKLPKSLDKCPAKDWIPLTIWWDL